MSSLRSLLPKMVQGIKSLSSFEIGPALVLGLVNGSTPEVKFGHVVGTTIDRTDVWEYGDTQPEYIFPGAGGEGVEIVSTDITDNQKMVVSGLDVDGTERSESVTLNGTTPVPIPGAWISIHRVYTDDSTEFLGDVNVQGDGGVSTNIFAHVHPSNQQTTQAIYMVPSDKVAIVLNVSAGVNKAIGVTISTTFEFKTARPGKVFRNQMVFGAQRDGTSAIPFDMKVPLLVGPLSKIKLSSTASAAGADVSGLFSMVLVDKNLVPSNILAKVS